jgi:phthiocerol/phenolphthiocerol synthesis type-I polyketide synthase C
MACRFPGATSTTNLWSLLAEGRCSVTNVPSDRWVQERYGHPRHGERGRGYTWSAGVLDDIWGFDPAAFGISPREAEQMDPQQRLLLELAWEALEDAGVAPSELAGTETGVFVGASAVDHANGRFFDMASTDAYFATGNVLSVISNRISYILDLRGPSFTVDTACSSSLVALNEAVQAIHAGRIDTALVAGVNILASPFAFISFSQASMLSRTGLCQAFSARADGYVRAEGGAVLVLQSEAAAARRNLKMRGLVVGVDVNSDGRTNGISLPSKAGQAKLLERVYGDHGVAPDQLAFVEAHGTGTPVGDPIEAMALGETLGRRRSAPLLVGSVKSNIGHTEAAAGVAGVVKALLALERETLPASLHCDELSPNIDFSALNLSVNRALTPLPRGAAPRMAGVNSFGFGGTNAHVILAEAPEATPSRVETHPTHLMISAHSRAALAALASDYAERLDRADADEIRQVAAYANNRRQKLAERFVVPLDGGDSLLEALRSVAGDAATGAVGAAVAKEAPVAFVYSGNGAQYAGMGRSAYAASEAFRQRFDMVDQLFLPLGGWSLNEMMNSEDLATRLRETSVSQPLIFAIQAATTFALKEAGLTPSFVIGHSVGEVAAAEAAGILDLASAVRVIHFRSLRQELTRQKGGMAVVFGPRAAAEKLVSDLPELSIAADNSSRVYVISGPNEALDMAAAAARFHKVRVQRMDLAYPFHSPLMDPVEAPLLVDLAKLQPNDGRAVFVSTVTGAAAPGKELDGRYWWRNVREPVLFLQAIQEALRLQARIFVEIGPRPTLLSHIADGFDTSGLTGATLGVLDRGQSDGDPFKRAVATALSRGASVDPAIVFGADPGPIADLPTYPWQRRSFQVKDSVETSSIVNPQPWHPLIGVRATVDKLEWRSQIDTLLVPSLASHKIDSTVLLPGAAFAEMALAAARDWLETETATIVDLEISQPMAFVGESSREVACRIAPSTNILEILSRPRLGQTAWQLHASAKILRSAPEPQERAPMPKRRGELVAGEEIYQRALRSGLGFGPDFRKLKTASIARDDLVFVDLTHEDGDARYGLDPARLDSCFHGLILLFAARAGALRSDPYVPVRFGEIQLLQPGATIAHARIEARRVDDRVIVADFVLTDKEHRVIARLREGRFQAIRLQRSEEAIGAIVQRAAVAPVFGAARPIAALTPAAAREAAASADLLTAGGAALSPEQVLLEGWATSAALRFATDLAEQDVVDAQKLIAAGRLPVFLKAWFERLMAALARSGALIGGEGGRWTLAPGVAAPQPLEIIRALSADHPDRPSELLLAARATALLEAIKNKNFQLDPIAPGAIENFELGGVGASSAADALVATLERLAQDWPKDRALRVLQIGDGPLSQRAAPLWRRREARLTIFEPDRRRLEKARFAPNLPTDVQFADSIDQLKAGSFDIVLAAHTLHRLLPERAAWTRLAEAMAPDALLAAVEPAPSLFRDVVFGLNAALIHRESQREGLHPLVQSEAGWVNLLSRFGLHDVEVRSLAGADGGFLCLGRRASERWTPTGDGAALIVGGRDGASSETATTLAQMLGAAGVRATVVRQNELELIDVSDAPTTIVYLARHASDAISPLKRLAERCLAFKRLASNVGSAKITLWVTGSGATRIDGDIPGAVETGVWAFARTLANETPTLDIRKLDLAPGLTPQVEAERLRDIVLSGSDETEIRLDAEGARVMRFETFDPEQATPAASDETLVRLEKGEGSGLDRLRWIADKRRAPLAGEVEIEIEATGLNFRDVLWGASILPEEILEDGYAGANLGLECAGRIVRVGRGVKEFSVGDRVVGFARAAFATHATVPTALVARAPDGLSATAAATIPVAFVTAYYGLIDCARLKRGEWVLIHGGAGGVGLAALQIALWRGAKVIATAGTQEKRDLLLALGARHVFDSRSGAFVDDTRRIVSEGVDVVLNSLAGEAMERSVSLLKPFGRFVELGKRDYVANTHIGLRPFRRNLSYYGVDLDQLILGKGGRDSNALRKLLKLFAEGHLAPLPYRRFQSQEAIEAFRLMQQSGHIGKVVITPPAGRAGVVETAKPFRVDPDRVHLITGGFGGFGLEAARWLVDRGARRLALVGRSGASNAASEALLAELSAKGVEVRAESVDISEGSAVEKLIETIERESAPLAGVIHAAMVLDDAIVANLDAERLERVLRPKVLGAQHLDRVTRDRALDYFIMFSSATTMIGNPGQGAYVAANGFMEGLARHRRSLGLPGAAVAWGAIDDVGVLARSPSARSTLASRGGVRGFAARRGLDLMAEALSNLGAAPENAVFAIAAIDWGTARNHLPILRSPSYARLMRAGEEAATRQGEKIDVRALIAEKGAAEATTTIADTIVEEIARILRLPVADVSRAKPLNEIGLDSLMAVELGLGLEERFALDARINTSASAMTIVELAEHVVGLCDGATPGAEPTAPADAVARHVVSPELTREEYDSMVDIISRDSLERTRILN